MKNNTTFLAEYHLDARSIDQMSEQTESILKEVGLNSKSILRLRLSAETVMGIWAQYLGEDSVCKYRFGRIMGRSYIQFEVKGDSINPKEYQDELYQDVSDGSSILSAIGLLAQYDYKDGCNILKLSEPMGIASQLLPLALSILLAVVAGLILKLATPVSGSTVVTGVVDAIFNTLMNLLSTIAGPLIFLAVYSGIYGIGDVAALGKIGKRLVSRFIYMTYAALGVAFLMLIWFFPVSFQGNSMGNGEFQKIFELILNVVPANIVEPFSTGNALQIIFLAVACGIGTLLLANAVQELIKIVNQFHSIIQLLMATIGKLIPVFVFICVLDLIMTGDLSDLSQMARQVLFCVLVSIAFILLYAIYISIRYKVGLAAFLKKLMPTFLVAVTTASSAAAFGVNTQCCEKDLKIDRKMVNFGIPLGQVIYMPIGAVMFFVASLCIGESCGVTITPVWLVTSIFVSGILAIATPPIPGGALSCYTILFTQLGIPVEGIAIAISLDMIMDYFITACNLTCLQEEMYIDAHKLGMIRTKKK